MFIRISIEICFYDVRGRGFDANYATFSSGNTAQFGPLLYLFTARLSSGLWAGSEALGCLGGLP